MEAARHLLDTAEELAIRVFLAGSAVEYGGVRPEGNPVREDWILNPVSTYGLPKAWQTQPTGLYASRGVDAVVARIFNLDGPGLSERLFVGRLRRQIEKVLAGRRSAIELGPLSAIRDYVSTDEVAKQIPAIARGAEGGRVCHVASGIPVTMRELLDRYLPAYSLRPRCRGLGPGRLQCSCHLRRCYRHQTADEVLGETGPSVASPRDPDGAERLRVHWLFTATETPYANRRSLPRASTLIAPVGPSLRPCRTA